MRKANKIQEMKINILFLLLEKISDLRALLLGYKYDYDSETNAEIIYNIEQKLHKQINHQNQLSRRLYRTIAHYQAQLALRPITSIWLFEISCFLVFPIFLTTIFIKNYIKNKKKIISCDGIQFVFPKRWINNKEVFTIPNTLMKLDIKTFQLSELALKTTDVKYLCQLGLKSLSIRNKFPFQLLMKCAFDLAKSRAALNSFNAKFVLVYWEFSCSLSFITEVLEAEGVEVYNVMHGDKHIYAKHAFFETTRCYCWNQFYIDIFQKEFVKSEFLVFENPAFSLSEEEIRWMELNKTSSIGIAAPHISTLTKNPSENQKTAEIFCKTLNKITKNNALSIRLHPQYTKDSQIFLKHLSKEINIEDPKEQTPRNFILKHSVIIGTVSSLLLEAAHLGKYVIIIETPSIKSLQDYHFIYKMPNVYKADIDLLEETISRIR